MMEVENATRVSFQSWAVDFMSERRRGAPLN
jgi:hypothetical protein